MEDNKLFNDKQLNDHDPKGPDGAPKGGPMRAPGGPMGGPGGPKGPRRGPAPIKEHVVTDMGDGIFSITSPPMRFMQYVVIGSEKALLIDTGFGYGSLKKIVDGITDLPIVLINTHGHPDHVGGNAEFGSALLHSADFDLFAVRAAYETRMSEAIHWPIEGEIDLQPTPEGPTAIEDGDEIDLGGRKVQIILTPGHTKGSICIFDEQTGSLFAGDNIHPMAVAMTEPCAATVSELMNAMEEVKKLPVKKIYSGHSQEALDPVLIDRVCMCCQKALAGETGELEHSPRGDGYTITVDGTSIRVSPDKLV